MKAKLWKVVSLVCLVVVITVSISACATNPEDGMKGQEATTAKDTKEKDSVGKETKQEDVKVSEPVKYTIYRNVTVPQYPEDGGEAKQLILDKMKEDGLDNIDFEITCISGSEYKTKLNLLIASGSEPDMFNVPDIEMANRLADEGAILNVEELLKLAPNYASRIREKDLEALRYNDGLYLLPIAYRPESFNTPATGGFVVREDWMNNLGIEMPRTLDELHSMLVAFTKDDPDNNGIDDTYGLGGAAGKHSKFEGIFGAFGIIPEFWFERDGVLQQGYVLPEAKEALAVLRQWYAEGLIDPDFPVIESKQRNEKMINSKIGVWQSTVFQTSSVNSSHAALRNTTEGARLIMLETPEGPDGLSGWAEVKPGGGRINAISSKVKDPERLMELINWATSDEGAMMLQFGREGIDYNFDEDANTIENLIEKNSDLYSVGFGNPARIIEVTDRRWMTDWGYDALEVSSRSVIENEFWKTVPAMFDYPDINKLWEEYYVMIITGILPLDAWDEFVEKYYRNGGQVIQDQVNEEWIKSK